MYTSKRVLCLITPHFLQSEYCLDEFHIAYSHNAEMKKHRLIIVKHEEFDVGTYVDTVYTSDDEEQNWGRVAREETQPLLRDSAGEALGSCTTCSGSTASGSRFHKALALKDFVTRHTFINLSVKDSWRDQLLYAMPINRLGQVAPRGV